MPNGGINNSFNYSWKVRFRPINLRLSVGFKTHQFFNDNIFKEGYVAWFDWFPQSIIHSDLVRLEHVIKLYTNHKKFPNFPTTQDDVDSHDLFNAVLISYIGGFLVLACNELVPFVHSQIQGLQFTNCSAVN